MTNKMRYWISGLATGLVIANILRYVQHGYWISLVGAITGVVTIVVFSLKIEKGT